MATVISLGYVFTNHSKDFSEENRDLPRYCSQNSRFRVIDRVRDEMHENEEAQEIARIVDGDTEAFRRLIRAHQALLLRFATRFLCGNAEMAADVVQEAFLKLWGARATYQDCGSIRGWLLRTTHRLCIDHLRRIHPTSALTETERDGAVLPSLQAENRLQSEAIREAIGALPEGQRAVMVLFVYGNLSYEEIAQILEIPMGTVASRKHQAIVTLRERLREWK
jgi:RNA polymerase sigma-70 factor, ECF subfamily